MNIFTCKKCGIENEIDSSGPVTISGWYGNTYIQWGLVGGVSTVRATRYRCAYCDSDQPVSKWPFDN